MKMKEIQYKFSDFPIRYELEDYNRARDKYIRRIAGIADVKAMYQVGTISVAGISDIDLVIVLNDELRYSSAKNYSVNTLGEKARYLFMHNPLIVNKKIFNAFPLFSFAEHLKSIRVAGETITVENIAVEREAVNCIADIIDNMGTLLRYFTCVIVSGYCPVRSSLMKLNALTINIKLFKNITGQSEPSWDEFSNQIKVLRKGWFFLREADQKKQIVGFLKKALPISYELSFSLHNYLADSGYSTAVHTAKPFIAQQSFLRFSIFTNSNGGSIVDTFQKITNRLNKQNSAPYKLILVFFPFIFCAQWMLYKKGKGELSKSFERYLPFHNELDNMIENPSYKHALLRRIQFLNEQIKFLKTNNFHYGLLLQPPVKPSFYGVKRRRISKIIKYPIEKLWGLSNRYKLMNILNEGG